MYNSESAIVQDLRATIFFLRANMNDLSAASSEYTLETVAQLPDHAQAIYALGLRHSQRLLVDALVKAFIVINKDIDDVKLKTFDAILDSMLQKSSARDAVLDVKTHQHVFVARMLANAASLLVTPAPNLSEAAHAAKASLKTVEPGVQALEQFLQKITE